MDLITPNVKGMPYDPNKSVRIVDPNQCKLYMKHGLKPLDIYYSSGVIVMVFDKKQSYPLYKKYMEHELE